MIRVAVNLLWLLPGEVGGSEQYAVRLLSAVPDDGRVRLTLFAQPSFAEAHPDLADRCDVVSPTARTRRRAMRVALESTWLASRYRQGDFDLIHHLGGTLPPGAARPAVLTVHDLQPLDHPKRFGPLKRAYLARRLPRSVRAADLVITVSEFCRQRILQHFALDPDKVVVLPAPLPPPVQNVDPPAPAGWAEPFVLYPATSHPHKNHAVLLQALSTPAVQQAGVHLVLTGTSGSSQRALARTAQQLGLRTRVLFLGRVSQTELIGLYRRALALVFPSRYEGYGLPAVEAMAWGCPVLASDAAGLVETVGSGGRILPCDDTDAWAEAILQLVSDTAARDALRDAGQQRLAVLARRSPGEELCALYAQTAEQRT